MTTVQVNAAASLVPGTSGGGSMQNRAPEVYGPRSPRDAESGEPGRAAPVRLHRIPDAMRLLSLSRSVIYEQIRSGRLRSVRQGRTRLIPADAIADYVALLVREAGADHDGAA